MSTALCALGLALVFTSTHINCSQPDLSIVLSVVHMLRTRITFGTWGIVTQRYW